MSEQQTASGYVLWHRPSKYFRWREVATAPTTSELNAIMAKMPSGEFLTLPAGQHPKERRTTNLKGE